MTLQELKEKEDAEMQADNESDGGNDELKEMDDRYENLE